MRLVCFEPFKLPFQIIILLYDVSTSGKSKRFGWVIHCSGVLANGALRLSSMRFALLHYIEKFYRQLYRTSCFFSFKDKKKKCRCYVGLGIVGVFFRSAHIGQYLPEASIFAHSSQITLPHPSHRLTPVVGFPQISQGSSVISIVTLALALCSMSIPTIFARVARSNSLASNHSIA
jgi:hypothetical protein